MIGAGERDGAKGTRDGRFVVKVQSGYEHHSLTFWLDPKVTKSQDAEQSGIPRLEEKADFGDLSRTRALAGCQSAEKQLEEKHSRLKNQ